MRDVVVLNLLIPRPLRRKLKLLAVQREVSLRTLAREALEQLVTPQVQPPNDTATGNRARRGSEA
jgi:hypothetical protein